MAGKKGKEKNAKKTPAEPTDIPEFKDEEGHLKTLKRSHFPNTRAGRLAYCDYNIERWKVKRENVEKGTDPLAKKKKRRDRLMEQLKALDEELQGSEEEKS